MFSGGDGRIKIAVTGDENEIGEVREGINPFKAKEQNLSEHLGKDALGLRKNQAQPTRQQRSRENSAKPIEEEVRPI